MINWNEVTVGETEICRGGFHNRKVMGMCGPWVWLYDQTSAPSTYHKDDLHTWTIDDPWVEITSQCKFTPTDDGLAWHISFLGRYIRRSDNDFKVDDDGRRVWKRKERP